MSPPSWRSAIRGVLVDPVLLPRYLAEPLAQERLARITARTVPLDLIGATP